MTTHQEGNRPAPQGSEITGEADIAFVRILSQASALSKINPDKKPDAGYRVEMQDYITREVSAFLDTHGDDALNALMGEYRELSDETETRVGTLEPYIRAAHELREADEGLNE